MPGRAGPPLLGQAAHAVEPGAGVVGVDAEQPQLGVAGHHLHAEVAAPLVEHLPERAHPGRRGGGRRALVETSREPVAERPGRERHHHRVPEGRGGERQRHGAPARVPAVAAEEHEDAVEISNLNRQPLFGDADRGRRKATAAAERVARLHPGVQVEGLDRRLEAGSAPALLADVDVVVDASDNFATRFLANDASLAARRVLVHGAVLRYTAQFLTVVPGNTGCLRCLFEGPPEEGTVPTCAQAGVLGALAGFAGSLMAAEALRVLAGEQGAYAGRLVSLEARSGRTRVVPVRNRAGCPACGGAAEVAP